MLTSSFRLWVNTLLISKGCVDQFHVHENDQVTQVWIKLHVSVEVSRDTRRANQGRIAMLSIPAP